MKGIILAGGAGTRLKPATLVVNKHLLPVYDKPMIYYALSTLMLGGVREILIITSPQDKRLYEELLGDGEWLGLALSYAIQEKPNGVPEALIIGREFLAGGSCALILGDNIFVGHMLGDMLEKILRRDIGMTIFAFRVSDPENYGVVATDCEGRITSIVEKPVDPPSNWAIAGLYILDSKAAEIAQRLTPSSRGELEMIDVINDYLDRDALAVETMSRGYAWFDSGTHERLLDASQYIASIEKRQGLKIACLEEIALRMGFIDRDAFRALAQAYPNSSYGEYLRDLLKFGDLKIPATTGTRP